MEGTHALLIAIDGSDAAVAAVDEALELAVALGAPVRFVHAVSPLAEELFETYPEHGAPRQEVVARDPVLAQAVERADARGVSSEVEVLSGTHIDTGDLAAEIAGIAQGTDASMIVVGSRGRGPIAGSLLGSVSHNLIKWASVPVLIVNPPAAEAVEAETAAQPQQ